MANFPQDRSGYPTVERPPGGGASPSNAGYPGTDRTAYAAAYRVPSDRGRQRSGRPGNRTYQGRNSDLNNPYVNATFLGSGFPHPLPLVPFVAPPAPAFEPVQPGGSRPSRA